MERQNALNHQSRRGWLRATTIATTGTALLPALLTSYDDHRIPPSTDVVFKQFQRWKPDFPGWLYIRINSVAAMLPLWDLTQGPKGSTSFNKCFSAMYDAAYAARAALGYPGKP